MCRFRNRVGLMGIGGGFRNDLVGLEGDIDLDLSHYVLAMSIIQ